MATEETTKIRTVADLLKDTTEVHENGELVDLIFDVNLDISL